MKTINSKDIINFSSQNLDFSTRDSSYSPMFSTIGLQVSEKQNGIGALWLHYNRATREICKMLVGFPLTLNKEKSDICGLVFGNGKACAKLAFFDRDTFIFEAEKIDKISLFDEAVSELWIESENEKNIKIRGYSKNTDDRDPDEKVGFLACLKVENGSIKCEENKIKIEAENNKISFGFFFKTLEISEEKIDEFLSKKYDFISAKKLCENWFNNYTKNFHLNVKNNTEEEIICTAVFGLMFNSTVAQGNLSKHISAFPSRGGYPTHFIWDTYFQNLAYEIINPFLAEEYLLQIVANQRSDGKFPQFMCSTWARPHDTQPALFGWAADRLLEKVENRKDFIMKIASAVEKNNQWWLSQRMTEYGCIFCPSGLETGQDNSPRFDDGATLATDMNSYLLYQLKFTAKIFDEIGKKNRADYWKKKAKKLEEKITKNLYDNERNIFFDFSLTSKKKIDIVSPSSLLPLWAGTELDDGKEKKMIEDYLLNPELMFGNIPFPSIAYNEPAYNSENWWRGPTWLPIAWLMLEILEEYGYNEEYMTAVKRLYEMLIKDKKMHELFNSKTGEGMGCLQQGWTCAIFIKLCEILNKQG